MKAKLKVEPADLEMLEFVSERGSVDGFLTEAFSLALGVTTPPQNYLESFKKQTLATQKQLISNFESLKNFLN